MSNDKGVGNLERELSLADALQRWSDRDAWHEFRERQKRQRLVDCILDLQERGLASQEDIDILEREKLLPRNVQEAWRYLVRSFCKQLEDGRLVAEGYVLPRKLRSKRRKIPGQFWRRASINFEGARVRGDGLHFVDVIVRKAEGVVELSAGRKAISMSELQKWYKDYVADCVRRGVATNRDGDVSAGKVRFGEGVSVRTIRDLRAKFAPKEWSRKGRRPKSS